MPALSWMALLALSGVLALPCSPAWADPGQGPDPCPGLRPEGQPVAGDASGVMPALSAVSEVANSPVDLAEARERLTARGFRCQKPDPNDGLSCIGRVGDYPKDVILIVPPHYRPTEDAELVLHLHGHNPSNRGAQYYLDHFRYARAFAQSGRNAIFIGPMSNGKCVDFERDLAPASKFKPFLDSIAGTLADSGLSTRPAVGSVALAGHSGAYRSLATIVRNGVYPDRINELYLLDSMYGHADEFSAFAADPRHRFWSVYHDWDPDFRATAGKVTSSLAGAGVSYYGPSKKKPAQADLASHRVGFFYSVYDHDATDTAYLPVLLKQ